MIGRTIAALVFVAAATGGAMAQDASGFAGTWTGRLASGTPVQLDIPAGVAQGQPVTYFYNNQQQGPQAVTMMGNQMRLTAGGTSIVLGPVKGKSMPYLWSNGQNQAQATLTKR